MANPNDNLRRLYQNGLKHFSLPDFDTFQQDMRDEEKRKRFYNNMQQAYSLPDFDTFSQDIGAVTPPPAQPQAQAQPQQTTSTVKPVTDNTAQQASVQPTVQTSSQPAQPEGWKPTPMQQRAFQMQMEEANARLKKQGEEFKQRMEGIEKGNRPGAFMGEREFNPQTGKMETHYYTTQGERVGTRMEQSHANTEYHNWWENNTEAGKRSKEQRLQREFDEKLSYLWQRHNPAEGENAAEQAWSAAESAYNAKAERNREAANFNVQNFAMNSTDAVAFKQMETVDNFTDRLTTHDMDVLMDNAWNNLGEEGQKSLIDDCYQMLRRRNPGVDDLVLYGKAKEFARQQSDLRMYHLAVEKNLPKSNLEYFMRKVGDMNLVTNIGKGIAVNRVKKTGDMAAYEAANEQYRQDGHKILDVAGTVTGFALDPTTWMSAGVGGMATRGAMWAGGRVLAGRGATAAVTNAATRQFATSMTGRVIGGIAGGAANFGTFEGIKEMENQFAHGGHIVGQDDTGRYINEGYSASAVAGQAAHGFLMGGAIGWLTPVSGNVADKLVRSTSSTGLKVMERAGVYSGATMLEGTIFSVPEWIEGNRDAMDVWTDNMAMMVGFKAKHMIKSAGNVLGDLKASFDSPTNGRKNRLDFESRLRQRMDAPSDGGLSLTKDEAAELSKHGYGDLRELVESAERTGDATKGELITANAPEIVSRLTDMVTDPRISEAARAKMYYYATGRKLPVSTVMKGELIEDGEGGFIVESQGANGVITSRSFKSRKAADLELERIKRQTELNHIEIGERYQQTADFENRLQEACRTVAAENGWDMVEVYRTCEEARRNNLRGGDKQFDEAQQNILRKVTEAMGEFEETSVTDNMRGRINDKYGVDIDNAIRKEANRRTIAEQTAIDEYLDELIPKNAKERNTVEDAEAEDITNQKLLTDEPEATTPTNDAPIDPRFDNPTTPEYDPHQPGGEQKPVGRAVMKYQDRPVEVLSGRVVMMEDGTMIDNERSDASIVVRDLETGKVEMVSPDAILSYEGYPAEVEVPQDNVAPEAETPAEPQPKYTTGQIKIRNSDGTETRGVLTGFVDENGNHEYYVEGDLQQLHYASEHELDNILSEYTPDEPQEVKQPQPAEPQPVDPNRPTQEGVANVEDYDKGYSFGIDETQGISDSELTAKISELRTDAERLTDFGRGMLEAYEYEQQRRAMEQQLVPVDAETVPKTEETTLNPMETGVNITETVPKTEIPIENVQQSVDDGNVVVPAPATNEAPQVDNVSQPDLTAQAEPTPLQRIPRNEKNEPIFEQAESPEVGWDALVEFSEGDAATAKEIADTMVEEKRKAFEKAQKLKPKGKTPTEILASKKANTAELTKAQAEYEQWQRMAGVENARQSAIRSQQEVEARRLAAERAEAEKAEREAREEAARLEREALEGIPEWHMDTPENARKRGVRRFSGQMFTRQEPVQGVVGNEVEVKFSQKDLPKGRVAVIEASQLQPSHVQGQRNPMFFIEEAQPKNRTEAVSMFAAKEMAEGIRPKEITGSVTAYTGAPTVNTRGEVIQGNNRSDALRYLWQSNLPQQQQTYKQYLIDNAEQFGIDPEAVNAMQNPVLVNMLDVDDAEAIRLGQMTAQDTESGGIERIKPKNVAQTLGDNMRTFANMLLSSGEEDVSFGQLVDRNGTEVMKWMNQVGAISNTQFQSAFDSKSNLTAEAKNDLQKVLYQAVFKGASQQLEEMFDKLPAKAQRAILATAFRDMDSPFAGKMLPEIQASIIVYNQLMSDPTFANAKKMEEVLKAVEAFKQTIALDDRFEHYMPADNFSNFALHLAAMYKATDMSQATIASYFNQMYDLAQGKKAATLFDEADTTEYPLAEVINQVLNFEYQPAKNGNNDVANGGADVALRNQVSQGGELRGNEPPASGEQTPTGTEPSDSGAGASDDSSTAGVEAVEGETPQSTDAAPATVQAAVEAASAEVNTEPTPAQAEAGNYKKGHITIGEFDITIENPAGSVRKGIDADGKEWSTTMANTYGYIKGTEGVDGDHIDVFLHENMDMWNGRKVYVVDQTNTDGSFDEHKVMLGFNNKDEAMSAYLANYDATWGQTHPGLRISETNIEDFNKWVQSSHRKTKPFADYSTVSKITDEAPVEQPTQPAAAITGEGYKVEPKPYTNKQGKTLDTYLVTFDRDFSKEELSTLRAKAKALKGWYDRETRGWMLRSADDAKAFAKDIVGKSEDEVADEAPLSLADMEKPASDKPKKAPVNRVNVEGVMADLSTKGETKLSDHAEPVEPTQTKPKKRRWISDEDADEFNNLRDNLRNHFGKGDDIVQESAEGYGKPQPKQMDAEVLRMGTRMTYLMMKGGLRSFADYCEAMIDELPDIFDDMRPHLKSLYAAAQNMEEVIELGWDEEMDDRKTVKAFDVYNFDKPGAKDIIATSQHIVDEQSSQQHTDQIIQTLKDQRNEQRKKEADETSADTEAIADKAEAVASKVESELEVATTEQDAERLSRDLDKEIEDVNKQLALLGYYEAVEDDSKFHESYGYMLTAEKKAVSDATNLAKQIVKDLGIDIKVTSATTPLGRKNVKKGTTVRANLAPAGGEIYITLPLDEGRHLKMYIGLEPVAEQDSRRRGDNLKTDRIMYRVEWPDEKGYVSFERIGRNCWAASNVTYDELLTAIRREARNYLPEDVVKPATPLTPQPGEDMVQMAERVAKLKAPKKSRIPDEQPMNDLFGGLFDEAEPKQDSAQFVKDMADMLERGESPFTVTPEVEAELAKQREAENNSTTPKNNSHEKTDVQARPETAGRGGQQPRPNEPLGTSAEHEAERTDGGRMAQRGGEHTVSDTKRGTGVSEQHKSERGVAQPKNIRNNHAERGVDYAPKGEKARIDANLAAIEVAKKLLASGETATPKEMEVLRRYSGWGGLGSAFNEGSTWSPNPINKRLREILTPEEYEAAVMSRNSAYYTPAPVIDAMWDIAKALGFKGGNIVEGSAGIGNIIGLMPTEISERSNIHAVEIDNTTGGILSLLYPDAKVEVQGFEKTRIANGSVDLAITNVPFVTGLHVMDESGDSDLSKKFRDIHDFCIAKNVRKLREGGIGIFITSSGTLDKSQKLRNWLVGDKEGCADVVGVFRMNNQTFGGTAATSDIIVVRKRVNGRKSANAIDISTVTPARTASFEDDRGKTKDLPMLINRYFIEHPEYMGGEMFFGFEQGDTYRPTSMGLFPTRTADQPARMAAWVQHIAEMDWSKEQGTAVAEQTTHINEALGKDVKEGSMVTDSNGNLCVARMGSAVPLTFNKNKIKGRTKEQCFADYTDLKNALADVLKYQTEHNDDAGLQPLLDRLNSAYDTFVARYGNLNKNNNLAWLRNDVDFSSIVALETYSEKGSKDGTKIKTYGKTDIFSRRVVEKESEPAPKNVKDGIIASLYKYGRIDPEYLASQLGKSQADVKQEIIESGLGFENPTTGQMEVSYEYLSGNVREKLRQAREANEAANGAYDANIKALEAVVPMNIPAHLIEFTLGSSWVDPKLYERFVKERTDLNVRLTNAGGTWHMSEPYWTDEPKNKEMGIRSESLGILIPGHKLIEAAITNKTITVSKTTKNSDGTTITETDAAATTACATKVDEIRQDFKDWAREQMQNDPELSMRMEEVYNEKFNNSVPKSIPDEFVPEHFGGAATMVGGRPFRLRPHQAKAVIRATTQPVLLAHEVGTGKTYTLITTAMEMRRLGTARKPMIVVQNATVGQFVASAKALYPNAKVLTLEDADRNAEGRKAFYAKIKFNDWDMIVVPQSVFERIPDSVERQTQFIQDKIEEKLLVLDQMKDADPDGRSMIVRAAEREIEKLKDEISQLANGGATDKKKEKDAKKAAVTRQNAEVKAREMLDRATDDVEDFDSMGIDAILVDEAHEYKHLGFATAMQRGVKGVDPSFSKKSQGVFLKTQSVLEKTGGKNVVFATGTPISNTAAEIWTFMRYLMPADVMKDYGIYYFDDFVRNFGNLQQMLEFSTSGKYKENNRFAGYVNLPELVRIWSTVADTVLTREAGGVSDKIPQMEGGKAQDIFLPQTRALRSIMKFVKEQLDAYDNMSGKEKKENSHIPLVMYGIAKAAAVDARLVQSDAEDDPNSKTNEAVRQTLRTLEEAKDYNGTVAIFADNYQNKVSGFNLYEDIRKKLISAGVPEEQIVVMKSGMTVNKKLEIFSRVNAGEVRVIMGSTFTLGTGVNIQERLHTLIHLDAPNRPMDYTQRNGRILRQGNLHNEWGIPVRVLRFGVEDSLDVTAYQRLKTKGAIADSIMNGKQLMENSMENRALEEDQDLFGDITAQLSGSEYAMLKNQIEKEVRKLTAQRKSWEADQTYIHNRKRQIAGQNKEAEKRIAENKSYLEKVEAATVGDITVDKLSYPSVEAMEDFFTEQNKRKAELQEQVRKSGYSSRPATSDITISVGGFNFHVHTEINRETKQGQQGDLFYSAPAKMTYSCPELGIEAMPVKGNVIKNAVTEILNDVVSGEDFRGRIEAAERSIERNNAELQSISARDGVPFKFTEELAKAEEKLSEYEDLMKAEMEAKEAKYAELDKEVEAASNIELTEEDSEDAASEPIASYSEENANFASRYETQDGKTINYTSENAEGYGGLFDFDFSGENAGGNEVGMRSGANDLQRQGDTGLNRHDSRLDKETGEFSHVERIFRENGSFNFTSGEKIESADDVAFIFSALEDAAKEHSFVVLVKDGKPTVVELGMGTFTATMVDIPTASLAYNRIQPDQVYFVHNHPSGNLMCSPQDVQMLRKIADISKVPVYGVIINLKTGKYGTFDTDNTSGVGQKRVPENESPLAVHTLDKQIFAPNYDPMEQPLVRGSKDVAKFLNSQRMGDRAKMSFIILSRAGRIVGNIHTPFTKLPTKSDEIARYISERVIQFGGESAILYGDFTHEGSKMVAYRNLKDNLNKVGGTTLLDVVNVEGNNTRSANDDGLLYEPGSEYGASPESEIRYREVEDDAILTEFAEGKTVKAYRTMQVIDGRLYSPMATKVGGKTTPEIKLGVPEQSEEHPEIIKGTKIGRDGVEQGYVVIDKGLSKGTLTVAYNPYAHTSRTVLNDQFSSAYIRPNLVTVEVEVPESELTSGYRAHMAKDAVGEISWHSGSVSGQLAELGRPRRVILTRYDRPVRIVPFREVAQMIAAQLDGTDIAIPYNVVQPQLRTELERLGVAISEEATGTVTDEADFGKAEYVTDQEIERINARQQEMAQTSPEAKSSHAERMSKKFNTPVRIVADAKELTNTNAERQARMRKSKGFYDPATGEVVIVLPNNADVEDVAETVFHEVVAHKGLREMIGEEN
ncbi:helicase-related protein, partial [Duncaniella muris]|uniref:helicase-related protein n=1 Tax=Duncaniella muris TaxID=2094150 RepID=UPI003F67022D